MPSAKLSAKFLRFFLNVFLFCIGMDLCYLETETGPSQDEPDAIARGDVLPESDADQGLEPEPAEKPGGEAKATGSTRYLQGWQADFDRLGQFRCLDRGRLVRAIVHRSGKWSQRWAQMKRLAITKSRRPSPAQPLMVVGDSAGVPPGQLPALGTGSHPAYAWAVRKTEPWPKW